MFCFVEQTIVKENGNASNSYLVWFLWNMKLVWFSVGVSGSVGSATVTSDSLDAVGRVGWGSSSKSNSSEPREPSRMPLLLEINQIRNQTLH